MSRIALHRIIDERLWSKLFADLRQIIDGLRSFHFESSLEDEHNKTYGEFTEKITNLIDTINKRCAPSLFTGTDSENSTSLAENLLGTLDVLRMQRGDIYHGSVTAASPSKFCEIFAVAQQRFSDCAHAIEMALEAFQEDLIRSGDGRAKKDLKKEDREKEDLKKNATPEGGSNGV